MKGKLSAKLTEGTRLRKAEGRGDAPGLPSIRLERHLRHQATALARRLVVGLPCREEGQLRLPRPRCPLLLRHRVRLWGYRAAILDRLEVDAVLAVVVLPDRDLDSAALLQLAE